VAPMKLPSVQSAVVLHPFTPRKLAELAHASLARLWLIQFICAAICGVAITWFIAENCYPVINTAITKLPPHGEIRSGRLVWPGNAVQVLAEGSFLALVVDMDQRNSLRTPAHLQVAFGRDSIRFYSLLGYLELRYPDPANQVIVFNRPEIEPWWGAWGPPILAMILAASIVGLLIAWAMIAAIYAVPLRCAAFFVNRTLNALASWKLCGAALMPGALIMVLAIVLYGNGFLDGPGLLAAVAVHFVVGLAYLVASLFFLAPTPEFQRTTENPFAAPSKH
jgi:hypothetical protein